MLKYTALLISAFVSFNANSQSIIDDIDYSVSGFVTTTVFSDHYWFDNTEKIAVNFDITNNTYAIRGQLQSIQEKPIRRLTLEKEFFIDSKHDFIFKVGMFPRLGSFYNNITDAPGTTLLAILPFAEYNHRVVNNSTFNTIEGTSLYYRFSENDYNLNLHVDIGRASIENQCDIHKEVYRMPCVGGYNFKSNLKNYSIGGILEKPPWSFLLHTSRLNLETNLTDYSNYEAAYLTQYINKISQTHDIIGIKYDVNKFWLQSEYISSNVYYGQLGANQEKYMSIEGIYLLGGYRWTDKFSTHVVYSKGSDTLTQKMRDIAVGATYVTNRFVTSIEYHNNNAMEWGDWFIDTNQNKSWVASITYNF